MVAKAIHVPALEPRCGSWVVSRKDTGIAVFETFDRRALANLNPDTVQVETAAQYLARTNIAIKERDRNYP